MSKNDRVVPMEKREKTLTAVAELVKEINTFMKKPVLTTGSDEKFKLELIPTGILPMDVLFEGGIPKGRFALLYGDFSSAKSIVALYAIHQCQKAGGIAALLDAERSYDEGWAKSIGIDTDNLIVLRPESGEEGLDFVEKLLRSDSVDLVVIDSITALVPKSSSEQSLQDVPQPARLAALMSRAYPKLTAANGKTAVLFISQVRTNIGMTFGSPDTISGGKATGFYMSHIVNMKKFGTIKSDFQAYTGDKWSAAKQTNTQKFLAELTKSKLSKPFRQVYFNWDLATAKFDIMGYVIAQLLELGVITMKGAWWIYQDVDKDGVVLREVKAQGQAKFREELANDTDLYNSMIQKVCDHYGLVNIYAI